MVGLDTQKLLTYDTLSAGDKRSMDVQSTDRASVEETTRPRPPTRRSGAFSLSKRLKQKSSKDSLSGNSKLPVPTRLTRSKTTAFNENLLRELSIYDKSEVENSSNQDVVIPGSPEVVETEEVYAPPANNQQQYTSLDAYVWADRVEQKRLAITWHEDNTVAKLSSPSKPRHKRSDAWEFMSSSSGSGSSNVQRDITRNLQMSSKTSVEKQRLALTWHDDDNDDDDDDDSSDRTSKAEDMNLPSRNNRLDRRLLDRRINSSPEKAQPAKDNNNDRSLVVANRNPASSTSKDKASSNNTSSGGSGIFAALRTFSHISRSTSPTPPTSTTETTDFARQHLSNTKGKGKATSNPTDLFSPPNSPTTRSPGPASANNESYTNTSPTPQPSSPNPLTTSPAARKLPSSTLPRTLPILPTPQNPWSHISSSSTSTALTSSKPRVAWGEAKRWTCCQCGAETIVENGVCANLRCGHEKCGAGCV